MESVADHEFGAGNAAKALGRSWPEVADLRGHDTPPSVSVRTCPRQADVNAAARRALTRDQERSLWLHQAVADRLAANPDTVLAKANRNLLWLTRVHPTGMAAHWLARWRELVAAGPDGVFEALTSSAGWAVELRQNSPFAGVLSESERSAVLESFRAHWRMVHTTRDANPKG